MATLVTAHCSFAIAKVETKSNYTTVRSAIFSAISLRTGKTSSMGPKDVVREFFHFGSGSKKFSRQNEKKLVRLFPILRAAIGETPVRKFSTDGLYR
nr:hypothetical protein [Porphyromonas gingivalis]